jgi:hypothetical protein
MNEPNDVRRKETAKERKKEKRNE